MFASIETRWFLEPKSIEVQLIEKWFASHPKWKPNQPEPEDDGPSLAFASGDQSSKNNNTTRTDYYLSLDGYPGLSFKIREGKTEVKVLDKDLGLTRFNENCSGRVEKWIKWGPDLLTDKAIPRDVFKKPEEFVAITKDRLLIKYEIDETGNPQRVDPNRKDLKNGCQVELTRLTLNGTDLVSFGFESLGEDEWLLNSFNLISVKTIAELDNVRLDANRSYGYPALLSK